MASIFSGNAYSYNRSLHGYKQTSSAVGTQERVDFNKFQTLYTNALKTLQTDIAAFGANQFDKLNGFNSNYSTYLNNLDASSLNADKYNTPEIQKLKSYTYDPQTFVTYRNIFINVLKGLQNAVKMNETMKTLNTTIAERDAMIDTLLKTPLQKYIGTNQMTNIYTATNVNIQATELLPWFAEYLFQYGPPAGGFDTTLLAIIVDTQIKKGLYTLDYFLIANKTISL